MMFWVVAPCNWEKTWHLGVHMPFQQRIEQSLTWTVLQPKRLFIVTPMGTSNLAVIFYAEESELFSSYLFTRFFFLFSIKEQTKRSAYKEDVPKNAHHVHV
jgi:hypothetical protein